MAPESVSRLLDENADLKPLTQRLAHIKRLQRRYRSIAPERLCEASRVCAIDGTTVVICADSGAVAAALRHLAPRILEDLRRAAAANASKHPRDQELTSIRIEVQVKIREPKPRVHARGEMPVEKLSGVADKLADSPLKETLERIAKDGQSRSTRSKT
jgi:hypothetical protein